MRGAASRTLAVLAAAVAVGTALVYAQVSDVGPLERVTLRSGSYADFRQVFTREVPAGVSVPATLRFPIGRGTLSGGGGGPHDGGFREGQRGLARGGASPERVRDADLRQLQRAGPEPGRGRRLAHRPAPGVGGGRRVRRRCISWPDIRDRRRS